MKASFARFENTYLDSDNNRRTVVKTFLCGYASTPALYTDPIEYKKWLRGSLQSLNLTMRDLSKEKIKNNITLNWSFYALIFKGGWNAILKVPLANNPERGTSIEKCFETFIEAINFMRSQPHNHDFEIIINDKRFIYEMTDDNLVAAILRWN